MKKSRHIIILLLALLMVIAVPLVACDSCSSCKKNKQDEEEVLNTKTLQSISINTDNVKKDYIFDQELNTDGLVVTATFTSDQNGETTQETLNAGDYTVRGYKKNLEGVQTVKVSYTYRNVTKDATYNVTVTLYQEGLELTLLEGVLPDDATKMDTYYLSAEKKTVEIDTSKLVVKKVNKDGTVGEAITDYSTTLYKGQEKIELNNGKATVSGGAYAIIVEKASDIYDNYTLAAFAMIYVNDNITGIDKKSGETSQPEGIDRISSTWQFTVTYATGATKDITSANCAYTIETMLAGSKDVTVTYSDYNASGELLTQTCTFTCNITEFDGNKKSYGYSFSAFNSAEIKNDADSDNGSCIKVPDKDNFNYVLKDNKYFTGVNSFLKLGSGTVTYRSKSINSSTDAFELKDDALLVTFEGTGIITIGFSSNGGSNQSRVGLKGPDGKYLPASYTENANITIDDSVDEDGNVYENVYVVRGTTAYAFTYTITQPGTYVIASEPTAAYNRGCRLQSITMKDYVPNSAATASLTLDNQSLTVKKDEEV